MDTIKPQSLNQPTTQPARPAAMNRSVTADSPGRDENPFLRGERIAFSDAAQQLLQQGYDKLSSQGLPVTTAATGQRPTPQQSAEVILNFIGGRLEALRSEGASTEELHSTLEQGLAGFRKGLAEARSILDNLGALNERVNQGIEETQARVFTGLRTLADQLQLDASVIPQAQTDKPAAEAVTDKQTDKATSAAAESPARALRSSAAYYASLIERQESVELELQTRDGDIITLTLNNAASQQTSLLGGSATTASGRSGLLAYQQVEKASSQFSFSVQGELDEDELKALEQLFKDISSLSEEFFAGNFDKAFDLALSLELDGSEFSSLSLDLSLLTRASVFAGVSQSDNSLPDSEASPPAALPPKVAETTPFADGATLNRVQRILDLLGLAERFANSQQLLSDALAERLAQQQAEPPSNS